MFEYDYYLAYLRNKNEANIFAFILRAAENTEWNHVEIMRVPRNRPTEATAFYSAVLPQSRRAKESEVLAHYSIIKRRKLTPKLSDADMEALLNSYLGREYSLLQNFVIALKLSFHCAVRKFFNSVKLNLDKYLNCTEYCGRIIDEGCESNFKAVSLETISLRDLDTDDIGELVVENGIEI